MQAIQTSSSKIIHIQLIIYVTNDLISQLTIKKNISKWVITVTGHRLMWDAIFKGWREFLTAQEKNPEFMLELELKRKGA